MFKRFYKWISTKLKKQSPGAPETIASSAGTFSEGFQKLRLQHFTAREFLTLGAGHYNTRSRGYGLNNHPPRVLWAKLYQLARVLDEIRERLNEPIKLHSVYRSERYNAAIGGAPISRHKLGQAADISCPTKSSTALWAVCIQARRDEIFEGGIGLYDTFVHIDIRGKRANWDRRQ